MRPAGADAIDPGGDLADLREQNLRRVLATLLGNRKGLTQPSVVERTGLSRSTVSNLLVHRLEGVLRTASSRQGENSGRPVKSWAIDPDAYYSVGIDIGQTHVSVVLVNPFGDIVVGPIWEPIEGVLGDPHRTLALAAELVDRLVNDGKIVCADIAAVTVGLPGPVDSSTGVMTDDATRAWTGIDVREEIRKRWPRATVPKRMADNNANLSALAEHRFGAGRGARSLLLLDWSSGIGGGVILDGRLWRGHSGVAAEIGHLPVEVSQAEAQGLMLPARREEWPSCPRCRQANCLERLAGGLTVSNAAGQPDLVTVVQTALAEPQTAEGRRSREVLKLAAGLIGKAIGPILSLLDVERVVIAGSAAQPGLYALLVEDLSQGIAATALQRARIDASLEIGTLGRDAAALGAALMGLDEHGIDALIVKASNQAAASERASAVEPARPG